MKLADTRNTTFGCCAELSQLQKSALKCLPVGDERTETDESFEVDWDQMFHAENSVPHIFKEGRPVLDNLATTPCPASVHTNI